MAGNNRLSILAKEQSISEANLLQFISWKKHCPDTYEDYAEDSSLLRCYAMTGYGSRRFK
jgi:hypothetical protein